MVITRSKARSGQPPDLVASPRANPPRPASVLNLSIPQQPSNEGGVMDSIQENGGHLATPLAVGNERQPAVRKCRSDCLSCPDIVRSYTFVCNSTGRIHSTINIKPHEVRCKMRNYIYLLTCKTCGIQYVGESTIPINKRMNIHRSPDSACAHFANHYQNVCGDSSFSIQVIEKLDGTGFKNGARDKDMAKLRLEREDHWMKELRTVYPYGLNIKSKLMCKTSLVGKLYPKLERQVERFRSRKNRRRDIRSLTKFNTMNEMLHHLFSFPAKLRSNMFRKIVLGMKVSNLRNLVSHAQENLLICDAKDRRWYDLVIEMYLVRTTKINSGTILKKSFDSIPIFFHNKGLEYISLSSILHMRDVSKLSPTKDKSDNVPSVIYSLGKTIRNKIFNYKETVSSIDKNDAATFGTGIESCDCELHEGFRNKDHGHVLTGDLRFIKNSKLRRIMSKGPNFREAMSINWSRSRREIDIGLDKYIDKATKFDPKLKPEQFVEWKNKILVEVDRKISLLKRRVKPHKTNPVLKQEEVLTYLDVLHSKYVFVPIDKAANNIAIICKKFYVSVILKEIGILDAGNKTYETSNGNIDEIIHVNLEYNSRLNLTNSKSDEKLPMMYWTPKLHKNPVGSRFIIASKNCSTKPLSKVISNVFKFIYNQVESFHKNATFISQ